MKGGYRNDRARLISYHFLLSYTTLLDTVKSQTNQKTT
nr:MAG TPA: hypothetical protein [Caudoviricetes sp.]